MAHFDAGARAFMWPMAAGLDDAMINTVDPDLQLRRVEADMFGDGPGFAERPGQGPGGVAPQGVGRGDIPVLAVALVRALRHGLAHRQQLAPHVLGRKVVTDRRARLEQQLRTAGFGDHRDLQTACRSTARSSINLASQVLR